MALFSDSELPLVSIEQGEVKRKLLTVSLSAWYDLHDMGS
jgi:hypothetical protein